MGNIHFTSKELQKGLKPSEMDLQYTSCRKYLLKKGSGIAILSGNDEVGLMMTEGECEYSFGNQKGKISRFDVLYIPRKEEVLISCTKNATMMLYSAPAHRDTKFACIRFKDVSKDKNKSKIYGDKKTNTYRKLYNYIDDSFDACRLMMGLCFGETGGWSSWPPHEHSKQREEVYYYFDLKDSFIIQCVYEKMDDPLFVGMVRDGEMVSVPKGYHPNVSSPGGKLSFIYVMTARTPDKRTFMDLTIQKEFKDIEFK
jgi:5-deoxy-glucuronate isomerase